MVRDAADVRTLANSQQLVRLQTQAPAGMGQAVGDCQTGVVRKRWTVHGLEKEMIEPEMGEEFGSSKKEICLEYTKSGWVSALR